MGNFIKIKAGNFSLSHRGVLVGGAVNDAWYITNPKVNGKKVMCPTYCKWLNMLKRAYNEKYKKKHPSYNGVTVCDEWLSFSNFERWFERNSVAGFDLDKDIKIKGNKVYSPSTCLFVHNSVNKLLTSSNTGNKELPEGVSIEKKTGKFRSRISIDNVRVHLGTFNSVDDAKIAYIKAKNNEIIRKASKYPRIKKYLMGHLL